MGIFKLLKKGMAESNKKFKVVIYLWAVNVLFALMVVLPFYFVLKNHMSRSLMGESLLRGFDYLWLGDAVYKFGGSASLIPFWFMVPAAFYLFLHIFLNGGIIGRLNDIDTRVCLAGFSATAVLISAGFSGSSCSLSLSTCWWWECFTL